MATPWVSALLTKLGHIKPDGANTMTMQRNAEVIVYVLRQIVTAFDEGIESALTSGAIAVPKVTAPLMVDVGDEATAITTGVSKKTFRLPTNFTLTGVRASVTTAPTGAAIVIDINVDGATILSTKISIDISQTTSTTAATAPVISDSIHTEDQEVTVDFDAVGSGVAGAGVKVILLGYET